MPLVWFGFFGVCCFSVLSLCCGVLGFFPSVYRHRMESVLAYLGELGLIFRNSQCGRLPKAQPSLESFSFPVLLPPSSAAAAVAAPSKGTTCCSGS